MTGVTPGTVVILSENPIHDTGGGQRSAQLALEFLRRGHRVLFLSRGKVTETVDLGLAYGQAGLTQLPLSALLKRPDTFDRWLGPETLVISQVPIDAWVPLDRRARRAGALTAYDLIDLWGSELGAGWYSPKAERRLARSCDLLLASAPSLVGHLAGLAARPVHLVPNAFNSEVFDATPEYERPADLPAGRIALYVGALWGGWFDWDLVGSTATALPETQFVFVGDHRGEGGALPSNCHFLGLKPQSELPAYLAHSDLGFLPWRVDALTHATSPLKVFEFAAMGLPVVAPDLEPLRGLPGVRRATDAATFTSFVATTSKATLDPGASSEMRDFSRENSWERRVDTILSLAARERGPGGRKEPRALLAWLTRRR